MESPAPRQTHPSTACIPPETLSSVPPSGVAGVQASRTPDRPQVQCGEITNEVDGWKEVRDVIAIAFTARVAAAGAARRWTALRRAAPAWLPAPSSAGYRSARPAPGAGHLRTATRCRW